MAAEEEKEEKEEEEDDPQSAHKRYLRCLKRLLDDGRFSPTGALAKATSLSSSSSSVNMKLNDLLLRDKRTDPNEALASALRS